MKIKEYLDENYVLKTLNSELKKPEGWIEVPEGAERFTDVGFFKGKLTWFNRSSKKWCHSHNGWSGYDNVLWQRDTQPESLPFVDDEVQSINDKYAEIKNVLKAVKVKSGSDSDHTADAMSYGLMGVGVASGGVDETLKERQSQYGCYEDVAFVTENIIGVLKKCNYDSMPHTHRMAMYMIASKMARLVNGDCNHVDSWHDIQGYAKLVEDLL